MLHGVSILHCHQIFVFPTNLRKLIYLQLRLEETILLNFDPITRARLYKAVFVETRSATVFRKSEIYLELSKCYLLGKLEIKQPLNRIGTKSKKAKLKRDFAVSQLNITGYCNMITVTY